VLLHGAAAARLMHHTPKIGVDGRFIPHQSVASSSPATPAESAAGGPLVVRGKHVDVEAVKAVYADRRYGNSLKRFMERNIYGTFRPGSQKVKRRLF